MLDFKLISADHHIVEHPRTWERVQREYGDRAPRIVENPDGYSKGFWIFCEGMKPMKSGYFAMGYLVNKHRGGKSIYEDTMHFKKATPEFIEKFRFEDFPGCWEPNAYAKAMTEDNVEAAVVLSSYARMNYLHDDAKFQRSIFRSYNEWILEFASAVPNRLFAMPLISILDMDLAIADMTEYVKRGCKSVHIPTTMADDSYIDEKYERLWATAVDLDIPLTVHSGSSQGRAHGTWGDNARKYDPRAYVIQTTNDIASGPPAAWKFVSNLIFSGVFDRYPTLKVGCAEFGIGVAASAFASVDYRFTREAAVDPEKTVNKLFPSEYLRNNVFFTFEDDPVVVRASNIYGEDNFMWGSDFPHHTSTYPNSAQLLESISDGADPGVLRKMGRENVNKLYRLV